MLLYAEICRDMQICEVGLREVITIIALDYLVKLHTVHTIIQRTFWLPGVSLYVEGRPAFSSPPPPHSQGLPHRGRHAADKPSIGGPLSNGFDFIVQSNVCEGELQLVGGKETAGASRNALADALSISQMFMGKRNNIPRIGPMAERQECRTSRDQGLGLPRLGFPPELTGVLGALAVAAAAATARSLLSSLFGGWFDEAESVVCLSIRIVLRVTVYIEGLDSNFGAVRNVRSIWQGHAGSRCDPFHDASSDKSVQAHALPKGRIDMNHTGQRGFAPWGRRRRSRGRRERGDFG